MLKKNRIMSELFGWSLIFIYLLILFLLQKIKSPGLLILISIIFIGYLCYEIYSITGKRTYDHAGIIIISDVVIGIIILIFIYFYLSPIEPSNYTDLIKRISLEKNFSIILFLSFIINAVFKSEMFKYIF